MNPMPVLSIPELESAITELDGRIRITCRVQPRASRDAVAGMLGNALKIALTAPPVEGKANAALCAFFAQQFKCSKSAVSIISGTTSKHKTVEIQGITRTAAREILTGTSPRSR